MLIRVGPNRGFNMDYLQGWDYEPAPEPVPEPPPPPSDVAATAPPQGALPDDGGLPEPEPLADSEPAPEQTEVLPPDVPSKLTLHFTHAEVILDGEDADKLQAYLLSKISAAV